MVHEISEFQSFMHSILRMGMNKAAVIEALKQMGIEADPTLPLPILREYLREHQSKDKEEAPDPITKGITSMNKAELKDHCRLHGIQSVSYTHLTLPTNREV